MRVLHLVMKGVYFDQIRDGLKRDEYRLRSPYWRKRIEGKTFGRIDLSRGYAPKHCQDRHLSLTWRGYDVRMISHPQFGPHAVEVYAIRVRGDDDDCSAPGSNTTKGPR